MNIFIEATISWAIGLVAIFLIISAILAPFVIAAKWLLP